MKKIDLIIWDFDGVILDSDDVRIFGFKECLKKHGNQNQIDLLINYHKENGGLSRYNKIGYFFSKILKKELNENLFKNILNEFNKIMINELSKKKYLINETVEYISNNYKNIEMHIASGSDHNELNFLCEKLKISHFFKSINGSPTTKFEIVKNIFKKNKLIKDNAILIGDSINDYEAAKFNSIIFYGYNNSKLIGLDNYIKSFSNF